MKTYQEINAETIDRWIENGWEWGKPITHETYINAQKAGAGEIMVSPEAEKEARSFAETFISEGREKLLEEYTCKSPIASVF